MKTRIVGIVSGLAAVGLFAAVAAAHTVNASSLNVRSGPGTGYSVIGTLSKGTVVNTVKTSGSWTYINSPKTGWVASQYLTNTPHTGTSSNGTIDFTWPHNATMTSTYYSRRSYGYHAAIDLAAGYGTASGAARSGYVRFRGWSGGYGNLVIVSHGSSYETYYAHNSRFGYGGNVSRGTTIAYVGSTGNSSGPHTHFEIRRYGSKLYIPGYGGKWVSKGSAVPYNYSGI